MEEVEGTRDMETRYDVYGRNTSRANPTPLEDSSYKDYRKCNKTLGFSSIYKQITTFVFFFKQIYMIYKKTQFIKNLYMNFFN